MAVSQSDWTIRRAGDADMGSLTRLFFTSVREGAGPDYTESQRAAWAPDLPETEVWRVRLADQKVWLAQDGAGEVIGFMTLRQDGHIDFAFVAPAYIGRGVAYDLYGILEAEAKADGLTRLTSDASTMAKAFFTRQGWEIVREQAPVRHGVALKNWHMAKSLNG